jgi:effector-binding domain-containing protein/uncharacterized protein YndB with AHSA1/START domain
MTKVKVVRSIKIDAPAEKIFPLISDFHHWTTWSPWLLMEPEAKVRVDDNGKYYEWEGSRIGSGNMRILSAGENKEVEYDLEFLKPWKSSSRVKMELKPAGGQTQVDWYMFSSLPFFMFWMKKSMQAFIGMDFDRGLNLLKDYAEDGVTHSKLDFRGEQHLPETTYIGITNTSPIPALGKQMSADFNTLSKWFDGHGSLIAGQAFSIYHKWDMAKNKASYTSAMPVSSVPESLPNNLISGKIPATRVYTLAHTGPYSHLGNAWSTLFNMQRSKAFRINRKIHPFEVYKNVPGEVPENDLLTHIHFPVK